MNKAFIVILVTIGLDAIGGGLIFPILPDLLAEVAGADDFGWLYGALIAAFALMQFAFSPALGAISDRYGRRPVILLSLGGALIDYLFMALSPWGWALVIGRAIAGLTSASMGVATAYVTDITDEADRAGRFGIMGAVMGLGFMLGPVVGGLLSLSGLRMPFLVAALLNGANLVLALFVLPETRKPQVDDASRPKLTFAELNPLAALSWIGSLGSLLPLVMLFVVFNLIAVVPGTIWALYGIDRFGWTPLEIGISMSIFGVGMMVSQAVLTGWFTRRFGDFGTVLFGMGFDTLAFVLMGLADQSWMGFAVAPIFALGGIIMPALQSLVTGATPDGQQGRVQGVLTSLGSVAAVIGPVACTAGYFATHDTLPGTVWLVAAGLYVVAILSVTASRSRFVPAEA